MVYNKGVLISSTPSCLCLASLPNNHVGADVYAFQLALCSADVVMLGQAVVQNGSH